MVRLHTSNDTDTLATALGKWLCGPRDNPLAPARVLVPQAGLRRWLQVTLAERHGVIANVDFTPPAQFAWELLADASPELPRQSPFDVDVLRWHLYELLGERLDGATLVPLRDYLAADGDPLRRYALSFELARVYERMQGYRRSKLLLWERGNDAGNWQGEVWRRLLPRVGGVSRAARVDAWLRAYDPEYTPESYAEKPVPPGLPAHLSCFACANVSPDVLRMLAVAGLHCDVDFFLPLPSKEYLGDTPRSRSQVRSLLASKHNGNPLVVSLGGAAAEFVELLYGYEHVQPGDETDTFAESIPRDRLLGRVRDDILNHAAPRADERQPLPDDSLQFRACHTPLREVQTLHDALLAMFEDERFDPPLQPRDIAVMMPDVAAYRPAIEAVFGGVARNDARFLPYNLGDIGASTLHPVVQLFLDLLDAPTSRWEASEILDVLAAPGVMRRFDLDADALERLSKRVRDAGVRWGENEDARKDCGGYREFSWAFGIDRMLAGFACGDNSGDDGKLVGGTAPLEGIEGAAFAHLDAVLAVTETWRRLRELSQRTRTAGEWQRVLNEVLDALYQPDSRELAETRALERIRAALEKLADDCRHANVGLQLPWPDVRGFLRDLLADADPQQYLFTGGITFCGMVPLRVVPFRVICLLGMNETAFPRREASGLDPLLADRRAGKPERGDRDVRADDRLLFLQLLAAARERFYVSWIGRDTQTNKALPSSTIVAELMDVVRDHYLLAPIDQTGKDRIVALLPRVQPLHPFDARLFDPDQPDAQSFRHEWLAAAQPSQRRAEAPPFVNGELPTSADIDSAGTMPAAELTLDALRGFFLNPAQGFLETSLALRLPPTPREDSDTEPLAPADGLTRWHLTRALLEPGSGGAPDTTALLRARGKLPPGAFGVEALRDAATRANALHERVDAFTAGAPPATAATVTIPLDDGTRLSGTLADRYPQGLLRIRPGMIDGRQVLRAWLDALFAAASDDPAATLLTGLDKQAKAVGFELPQPARMKARTVLTQLVALYRVGLRAPLPFFVRTSWQHALHCAARDKQAPNHANGNAVDLSVFSKAVDRADDDYGGPGDFADAAVAIVWRGIDPAGRADAALAEGLHQTALAVFSEPARAWTEQFK